MSFILTKKDINNYIESKKYSWSSTSLKSEKARLYSILKFKSYLDNPLELYKELSKTKKPYTIKTTFLRLSSIYSEIYPNRSNPYKELFKTHGNLFKNVYTRKLIFKSLEEVKTLISQIKDENIKKSALMLLTSGLRASELSTTNNEMVVGKGNKVRHYLGQIPVISPTSYSKLYRALRKVGLKPHDLRKAFATQLSRTGISSADLCEIMGWSSFETAKWYIQPSKNDELKAMIQGAINANL